MQVKLSITSPQLVKNTLATKLTASAKAGMANAQKKISALIIDRVGKQADAKLGSMAKRYRTALADPKCVQLTATGVTFTIVDPVVRDLEKGFDAFDMKPKMLKHAKEFSKAGVPYIDVPFSHSVGSMPKAVHSAISKMSKEAGGAAVRLKQNTPGKSFKQALLKAGKVAKTQQVTHKRGKYDDMLRSAKPPGKGGSSTHGTIRRISANSAPSAWWNPGFKGVNLFKAVLPEIKADVVAILRDSLAKKGT